MHWLRRSLQFGGDHPDRGRSATRLLGRLGPMPICALPHPSLSRQGTDTARQRVGITNGCTSGPSWSNGCPRMAYDVIPAFVRPNMDVQWGSLVGFHTYRCHITSGAIVRNSTMRLNTSRSSTTGTGSVRLSDTGRQFSSWRTGPERNIRKRKNE